MRSRGIEHTFTIPALLGILFATAAVKAQVPAVRVWQDRARFITYAEGDPDPVPQFSIYTPDTPNYPYPLRSSLTQDRRAETWRTLNLENEYLICHILPDFGGHLHSCLDKRNGREMFYANPVIKKGLVGLRGAWAPMGIESNFPATHARDTASPVDFAGSTDADGSGRVVLEDIDRVTGMQWRVDYILRPGQAVLEQKVTFHNRGIARQPYLWWANADIELDDPAMRFILPTNLVAENGGTPIESWPINSVGQDVSRVAGHTDSFARFSNGSREPFMAVYKPGSRSGVAHFADASDVVGKKIWLWGSKGDDYARRTLTENFNSYGELQAGLFADQQTFEFLEPQQTRTFTEYWMPIRDLGGFSRATPQAIVNLERRTEASGRSELLVELGAIQTLRGATLRLLNGGQVAWEARVDLNPAISYAHALENPVVEPYTFRLADSSGKILLEHTENKFEARAASEVKLGAQPQTDWNAPLNTQAFALARGEYNERAQHWNLALRDYAEGIQRFSDSLPMRKAAGRLAVALHRYEEATSLLARVHTESPGDDETAYLFGAAQAELGNLVEARKALNEVRGNSAYARPAAMQLVRLAARDQDFSGALTILTSLLSGGEGTVQAGGMEVALLRRSGKADEAGKSLAYWSAIDPADIFLRYERARLAADDPELWMHLAADAERVIEIADEYMSLGLYEDALDVLGRTYPGAAARNSPAPAPAAEVPVTQMEPGAVAPADSPLISYYRAYCRSRLGQDGSADLRTAASQSPRYAFPFRTSSLAVLRSAEQANPGDALAHLLAGRYYMSALLDKEAVAEWEQARRLNARLPEVHRDLARALLELNKDAPGALAVIAEGLKADPANPELRAEFDVAAKAAPRGTPVRAPVDVPLSSVTAIAAEAMRRAAFGNPDEAARMFDPKVFRANKEPDDVRRAYIEVQLQRLLIQAHRGDTCPAVLDALAQLGAEDTNLPFTFYSFGPFMKSAHFQYYAGVIEASCGDERNARKRWAKIAKQSEGLPSPEFVFPLLANAKNGEAARAALSAALTSVQAASPPEESAAKPGFTYAEGMLLEALGQAGDAEERLMRVSRSARDPLLQYLAGVALREMTTRRPR